MKCEIKSTGKTPVKNEYRKIPANYTVYCALFLQICFRLRDLCKENLLYII